MSTSKRSGRPSRSTSPTSTAMPELLVDRTAFQGASRKCPRPSLSQNSSGSSKSFATYRSGAIAVQIHEHGREAEVLRLLRELAAPVVHKAGIPGDGLANEPAAASVAVEEVGICALLEADASQVRAIDEPVVTAVLFPHREPSGAQLADDVVERALLRRHPVERGVGLVVGDVQVE